MRPFSLQINFRLVISQLHKHSLDALALTD